MTEAEFLRIRYFTSGEAKTTGADIDDIKFMLFFRLNLFRVAIDRRVILVKNGLTTGNHKAKWHKDGMAVDITFDLRDGRVNIQKMFKMAIRCGFKGIGLYWNGVCYGMHLDIRPDFGFWSTIKVWKKDPETGEMIPKWEFHPLVNDPRTIKAA